MNFPTICIDNFYPNVDKVREFALSQLYETSGHGMWPGYRTKKLHEIDYEFFRFFTKRLFSVFFNFDKEEVTWDVTSYFQLIPPYRENKESILNKGWIHRDHELMAGIIYLNPSPDPDAGTSLFMPKKDILPHVLNQDTRLSLHKNEKIDEAAYEQALRKNHDTFDEVTIFKNVYNRLVAYDGEMFHRANSFTNSGEPRLTQVFFLNYIKVDQTPLARWRSDLI